MNIINQIAFKLFILTGWAVSMFGLFLFAVLGTLALETMSVRMGLPVDPELAGPMMIVLFVGGFICLNQVAGGALYRAMGWSNDE